MAPWTMASVDVEGAGGVGAGAGCTGAVGVVAGADDVFSSVCHWHCR